MSSRTPGTIPAGSLICFSTGEYSDYSYTGHFVTLSAVTAEHVQEAREAAENAYRVADEAQDAWKSESGEPYPSYVNKQEAFIAAMIRAGLLMSVPVAEYHLGSYGELEIAL